MEQSLIECYYNLVHADVPPRESFFNPPGRGSALQ